SRRTPRELLLQRGLLDDGILAVRIDGRIVDLHTPVDPSSELAPIRKGDKDALEVIRHSTSHVMAQAVQRLFPGTQVTIGPAIEHGFYYDFDKPSGPFTDEDLGKIENEMRRLMALDLPFQRKTMDRDAAKKLFD